MAISKRDCLVRVFAGFCTLKHSIDALVLSRAFVLENPQIHRTILTRLDFCDSYYESALDSQEFWFI